MCFACRLLTVRQTGQRDGERAAEAPAVRSRAQFRLEQAASGGERYQDHAV